MKSKYMDFRIQTVEKLEEKNTTWILELVYNQMESLV